MEAPWSARSLARIVLENACLHPIPPTLRHQTRSRAGAGPRVRSNREEWFRTLTMGAWTHARVSFEGGIMKAREIMTAQPACCTPDETLEKAARLMVENDCGCVPVVDDLRQRHILGVVTDRDIAARAVAHGRGPETQVRDVMSPKPSCCSADADVADVERMVASIRYGASRWWTRTAAVWA